MEYNFRTNKSSRGSSKPVTCPRCHDGTSRNKRGRFYDNGRFFKCWNCGLYTNIIDYRRRMGLDLFSYGDIKKDYIKSKKIEVSNIQVENVINVNNNYLPESVTNNIIYKNKVLLDFMIQREIPRDKWSNFGYMDNFYKVQKEYQQDEVKENIFDRRIVIIYKDKDKITGLNGRSLSDKNKKYKYLKFNTVYNYHYIYNLENIKNNKNVYIMEGEIDSMFIPNSVSIGGTNSWSKEILDTINNKVYFLDNDKAGFVTSREILKTTPFKVFSWKKLAKILKVDYIKAKDVNKFIETYPASTIIDNIDKCLVSGFKGLFEI